MASTRDDRQLSVVEPSPAPDAAARREAEIARLYARLTDGYQRIEDAIAHGQDVTAWEDFWIELLHQYEALCDEAESELAKAS